MSLGYIKYKLQKGEDLEEISRSYKISVEELRAFHNRHCRLDSLIGGTQIPKHVKELYLPQEIFMEEGEVYSTAPKTAEKSLKRSSFKKNRTYGVIQKRFTNDVQDSQIHFKVEVGNEQDEDLPYNQVIVKKHKTYYNEKEVESNIEEMYERLDQTLYPLHLNLNQDGTIDSIVNKSQIRSRWLRKTEFDLLEYYVGDLSEQIIKKIDKVFKDLAVHEKKLTDSLFYTFFFMPLYVNYDENHQFTQALEVPIFPFQKKVNFSLIQKMDPEISPTQKIYVRLTGTCKDERTYVDMETGKRIAPQPRKEEEQAEMGSLEGTYKLHAKDKTLFSANVAVHLASSPQERKKITVEIYELKT